MEEPNIKRSKLKVPDELRGYIGVSETRSLDVEVEIYKQWKILYYMTALCEGYEFNG
jgi:hypothetical protein